MSITEVEVTKRLNQLRTQPFMSNYDLFRFVMTKAHPRQSERVRVNDIVFAPGLKNWGEPFRGSSYITRMIEAIENGRLDLSEQPPRLIEYYGKYGVDEDGQHRVIASKVSGQETITADVLPLTIERAMANSPVGILKLLWRRHLGLWQGELHFRRSPIPGNFPYYAIGEINTYQGPWVFALELDTARKIFI